MSTGLILGVILGAAGQAVGIPFAVGFLAGSLIGNLVDPQKIEGPRLTDLKVQTSTYGKMIPYVWGTGRLAGNVIDQTDLEEHKETSGGKGGPEISSYTYSASFDIALCMTPVFGQDAIKGILRLWADGRLIWDAEGSAECPCTVYLGSETQEPDPTFEAVHGVGNVPAYRGIAHLVFADYLLTDFGNRIPQIEAEVFTKAGPVPTRIATFRAWDSPDTTFHYGATYDDNVITVTSITGVSPAGTYYRSQWQRDGTEIGVQTATAGPAGANVFGIRNLNSLSIPSHWWSPDDTGTLVMGLDISASVFGPTGASTLGNANVYMNDFIYTVGRSGGPAFQTIAKYAAPDGVPGAAVDDPLGGYLFASLDAFYSNSDVMLGTSDTGDVYAMVNSGGVKLWKFDADDMTLIHFWDVAATAGTGLQAFGNFHVYQNQIIFKGTLPDAQSYVKLVAIDPDTFALTDTGVPLLSANSVSQNFVVSLGGCLLMDEIGTFSMCPPAEPELLSTIVGNLSDMTPAAGVYDVTELTDEVRWFPVASNMAARNAIAVLRPIYFFDAVESDDIIKFRKRGGPAVFSIPDSSLCARPYGEESPDPLRTIRAKEQNLPRTVTMTYIDVDADYMPGSQSSPRQVTLSQQDVSLQVAVGLTADEGKQKVLAVHTAEWVERETFEWFTTRGGPVLNLTNGLVIPACMLEPCDVGIVRGREIRIVTRTEMPNLVIKWTGVLSAPSVYTQNAPGAVGGFVPQEPPGTKADTGLILIDGPLTSEANSPTAIRAALYKDGVGVWPGAGLYKSVDGGTTYAPVASLTTPTVVGTVATAIGDFLGGNVVDESNLLTVALTSSTATLESITDEGLLNGLNLFAYGSPATGWEFGQYRTATLVSGSTWCLSGLLRGRFGTEWRMGTHGANELFVLMSGTVEVPGAQAHIGLALQYKAATFGTALADATAIAFTNTGVALKPLSPVLLGGGYNAAGDLLLHWTERRRGSGGWPDGVDLPTTEPLPEAWLLQFATDATFTTVVRQPGSATASYTYTDAMRIADGLTAPINWRVARAGSVGYGYYAKAVT